MAVALVFAGKGIVLTHLVLSGLAFDRLVSPPSLRAWVCDMCMA
jgi:hypothetical protein